jgi:hypothetical protein
VEGHVWIALVKWYGERGAAQAWQEFFAEALVAIGFSRNRKDPTKFHHVERNIYVDSHVDDSHGTAPQLALAWLPPALEEAGIDLKSATVAGVGDSYNYLQVTYTRVSLRRFIVTPSTRYIQDIIDELGLRDAKPKTTPSPTKNLLTEVEGIKMIDEVRRQVYVRCVMKGVYAAHDRVELAETLKWLGRRLKPERCTEECWARLRYFGRFLVGAQEWSLTLELDENADEDGFGDMDLEVASSWARDTAQRKSTTCGMVFLDGAWLGHFVRDQAPVTQSSGECEFVGAGMMVNEGIGVRDTLVEWGFDPQVNLHLDSNAAIGMIKRRGAGKIRHIDIRHLFIQECLAKGIVNRIVKQNTVNFRPDVGTKPLAADRMRMLLDLLGVRIWRGGDYEDQDEIVAALSLSKAKGGEVVRALTAVLLQALRGQGRGA